jgi:hypothetical protein
VKHSSDETWVRVRVEQNSMDEAGGALKTGKGPDATLLDRSSVSCVGRDVQKDGALEHEADAFDFLINSDFSFHLSIA